MVKYVFSFLFALALLASCAESEVQQAEAIPAVTVAAVTSNAADYVGQKVSISGTVVHVCKHGGKRLFIIGEDPDSRFKITAGLKIGSFDVALEGSNIVVEGVMQEQVIDEAFLANWESELAAQYTPEIAHQGHQNGEEEHEETAESEQNQIDSYRKQLVESGKESLSFFNIEGESFKEAAVGV